MVCLLRILSLNTGNELTEIPPMFHVKHGREPRNRTNKTKAVSKEAYALPFQYFEAT